MTRWKLTPRKSITCHVPIPEDSDHDRESEPMNLGSDNEGSDGHIPTDSDHSEYTIPSDSDDYSPNEGADQDIIAQADPTLSDLMRTIRYGVRDPAVFPSEDAWNYARLTRRRQCIIERKFEAIYGIYHQRQRWHLLVDPRNFAKPDLVREFYCNLKASVLSRSSSSCVMIVNRFC